MRAPRPTASLPDITTTSRLAAGISSFQGSVLVRAAASSRPLAKALRLPSTTVAPFLPNLAVMISCNACSEMLNNWDSAPRATMFLALMLPISLAVWVMGMA